MASDKEMAPAVVEHPGARTIGSEPYGHNQCSVRAVQDRGRRLPHPVSEHEDILTGIAAGGYAVEVEDLTFAYALYAGDPSNGSSTRVASFREGRIGYREWATRSGRISPSLEDRLDHDIDELMA
jgi:hypothetical protein